MRDQRDLMYLELIKGDSLEGSGHTLMNNPHTSFKLEIIPLNKLLRPLSHTNSTGPFVLPCTVSTRPGQNTELCVLYDESKNMCGRSVLNSCCQAITAPACFFASNYLGLSISTL